MRNVKEQKEIKGFYFLKLVFLLFLDKYPGEELLDSMVTSVFKFSRNHPTVFHSCCTNLHSHQEYTGFAFSPYPHQHLSFIVFAIIVILARV